MKHLGRKGLVSVIIPCYNSESHIGECIESVLSQDYEAVEIVVVDDGSIDNSLEVVREYQEVRVITQANSGACVARNKGLAISTGEYVKFLDSDDLLEPGAISTQVDISGRLDEKSILYGDCFILRGDNKIYKNVSLSESDQTAHLMVRDILISTPLHKRWMLEAVGGFDERFRNGQEWNLHVRLSSEGFVFRHHRKAIFSYRIHDSDHRISNIGEKIKRKDRIIYSIKKTEMTQERLGGSCAGDVGAAIAMRYWWAARQLYMAGDKEQGIFYMKKAKATSESYDFYWPLYYRVVYRVLGFRLSEFVLSGFAFLKEKKYT